MALDLFTNVVGGLARKGWEALAGDQDAAEAERRRQEEERRRLEEQRRIDEARQAFEEEQRRQQEASARIEARQAQARQWFQDAVGAMAQGAGQVASTVGETVGQGLSDLGTAAQGVAQRAGEAAAPAVAQAQQGLATFGQATPEQLEEVRRRQEEQRRQAEEAERANREAWERAAQGPVGQAVRAVVRPVQEAAEDVGERLAARGPVLQAELERDVPRLAQRVGEGIGLGTRLYTEAKSERQREAEAEERAQALQATSAVPIGPPGPQGEAPPMTEPFHAPEPGLGAHAGRGVPGAPVGPGGARTPWDELADWAQEQTQRGVDLVRGLPGYAIPQTGRGTVLEEWVLDELPRLAAQVVRAEEGVVVSGRNLTGGGPAMRVLGRALSPSQNLIALQQGEPPLTVGDVGMAGWDTLQDTFNVLSAAHYPVKKVGLELLHKALHDTGMDPLLAGAISMVAHIAWLDKGSVERSVNLARRQGALSNEEAAKIAEWHDEARRIAEAVRTGAGGPGGRGLDEAYRLLENAEKLRQAGQATLGGRAFGAVVGGALGVLRGMTEDPADPMEERLRKAALYAMDYIPHGSSYFSRLGRSFLSRAGRHATGAPGLPGGAGPSAAGALGAQAGGTPPVPPAGPPCGPGRPGRGLAEGAAAIGSALGAAGAAASDLAGAPRRWADQASREMLERERREWQASRAQQEAWLTPLERWAAEGEAAQTARLRVGGPADRGLEQLGRAGVRGVSNIVRSLGQMQEQSLAQRELAQGMGPQGERAGLGERAGALFGATLAPAAVPGRVVGAGVAGVSQSETVGALAELVTNLAMMRGSLTAPGQAVSLLRAGRPGAAVVPGVRGLGTAGGAAGGLRGAVDAYQQAVARGASDDEAKAEAVRAFSGGLQTGMLLGDVAGMGARAGAAALPAVRRGAGAARDVFVPGPGPGAAPASEAVRTAGQRFAGGLVERVLSPEARAARERLLASAQPGSQATAGAVYDDMVAYWTAHTGDAQAARGVVHELLRRHGVDADALASGQGAPSGLQRLWGYVTAPGGLRADVGDLGLGSLLRRATGRAPSEAPAGAPEAPTPGARAPGAVRALALPEAPPARLSASERRALPGPPREFELTTRGPTPEITGPARPEIEAPAPGRLALGGEKVATPAVHRSVAAIERELMRTEAGAQLEPGGAPTRDRIADLQAELAEARDRERALQRVSGRPGPEYPTPEAGPSPLEVLEIDDLRARWQALPQGPEKQAAGAALDAALDRLDVRRAEAEGPAGRVRGLLEPEPAVVTQTPTERALGTTAFGQPGGQPPTAGERFRERQGIAQPTLGFDPRTPEAQVVASLDQRAAEAEAQGVTLERITSDPTASPADVAAYYPTPQELAQLPGAPPAQHRFGGARPYADLLDFVNEGLARGAHHWYGQTADLLRRYARPLEAALGDPSERQDLWQELVALYGRSGQRTTPENNLEIALGAILARDDLTRQGVDVATLDPTSQDDIARLRYAMRPYMGLVTGPTRGEVDVAALKAEVARRKTELARLYSDGRSPAVEHLTRTPAKKKADAAALPRSSVPTTGDVLGDLLRMWGTGRADVEGNLKLASYFTVVKDEATGQVSLVTVPDIWIYTAYGYERPDVDMQNPVKSRHVMGSLARLAGERGLVPDQLQAALWVGARAKMETDPRFRTEVDARYAAAERPRRIEEETGRAARAEEAVRTRLPAAEEAQAALRAAEAAYPEGVPAGGPTAAQRARDPEGAARWDALVAGRRGVRGTQGAAERAEAEASEALGRLEEARTGPIERRPTPSVFVARQRWADNGYGGEVGDLSTPEGLADFMARTGTPESMERFNEGLIALFRDRARTLAPAPRGGELEVTHRTRYMGLPYEQSAATAQAGRERALTLGRTVRFAPPWHPGSGTLAAAGLEPPPGWGDDPARAAGLTRQYFTDVWGYDDNTQTLKRLEPYVRHRVTFDLVGTWADDAGNPVEEYNVSLHLPGATEAQTRQVAALVGAATLQDGMGTVRLHVDVPADLPTLARRVLEPGGEIDNRAVLAHPEGRPWTREEIGRVFGAVVPGMETTPGGRLVINNYEGAPTFDFVADVVARLEQAAPGYPVADLLRFESAHFDLIERDQYGQLIRQAGDPTSGRLPVPPGEPWGGPGGAPAGDVAGAVRGLGARAPGAPGPAVAGAGLLADLWRDTRRHLEAQGWRVPATWEQRAAAALGLEPALVGPAEPAPLALRAGEALEYPEPPRGAARALPEPQGATRVWAEPERPASGTEGPAGLVGTRGLGEAPAFGVAGEAPWRGSAPLPVPGTGEFDRWATGIIQDAPPIPGTAATLVNAARYPQVAVQAVQDGQLHPAGREAGAAAKAALVRALGQQFERQRQTLEQHLGASLFGPREVRFGGLILGRGYLAINVSGVPEAPGSASEAPGVTPAGLAGGLEALLAPNRVYVNLHRSAVAARDEAAALAARMGARQPGDLLLRELELRALASHLSASLVHELTHQQQGAHGAAFDALEAANREQAMGAIIDGEGALEALLSEGDYGLLRQLAAEAAYLERFDRGAPAGQDLFAAENARTQPEPALAGRGRGPPAGGLGLRARPAGEPAARAGGSAPLAPRLPGRGRGPAGLVPAGVAGPAPELAPGAGLGGRRPVRVLAEPEPQPEPAAAAGPTRGPFELARQPARPPVDDEAARAALEEDGGTEALERTRPGAARQFLDLTKLGMLLSVRGLERQLIQNVAQVGYQVPERAVAGALALPQRALRAAGGRPTTDLPRPEEAATMLVAQLRALPGATVEAGRYVAGRPSRAEAAGTAVKEAQRGPLGPGHQEGLIDAGYRLFGFFDTIGRQMAREAELAAQRSRGVPEEAAQRAAAGAGAYRTVQQELGRGEGEPAPMAWVEEFTRAIKGVSDTTLGQVVIPFLRIMYNGVKYDLERSPAGLLKTATVDTARQAWAGARGKAPPIPPTEYYERWARGLLGTGLALALMVAAGEDNLTGPEPTDPTELKAWRAENKRPFSMRIAGRWVPVGLVPGLNATLVQVMSARDYLKRLDERGQRLDPEHWYRLANRVVTSTAKNLYARPFFESLYRDLEQLFEADEEGGKGLGEVGAGLARSRLLPGSALLREIERVGSDLERAPRDPLEAVMAGVPGLSGMVPPRRDVYGRLVRRPGGDGVVGGLERLLTPESAGLSRRSLRRYEGSRSALQDTAIRDALKAAEDVAAGRPMLLEDRPTPRQRRMAEVFAERENEAWTALRGQERERLLRERARGGPLRRISRAAGLVAAGR
jgi:hypothetical protein